MLELNRTPGWRSRIFRAIERWPENMTLWSEWEQLYTNLDDAERASHAREFYDQHFEEMTRGAVVLWPEQEDLYALMQMRVESGRTSFEREKQGSPLAPELCEWPAEYFDEPLWFDAWPARTQLRTMALDPSKGADAARSDYSAYVMLAVDRQGVLYVQADLARRPLAQMVADGVELFAQFRPDGLAIESNHFQELLAPLFADEAARRGMLPINPWLLNNTTNKQTRIRRLGAYLAGHRLRFKAGCPSTELLVQQLQEFPLADHDDGPDALEMAIRLAAELLNGPSDDGLGRRLPLSG